MSLLKNFLIILYSFIPLKLNDITIYNAPNILYLYNNVNTTNIYNKSQSQISCDKLIKYCPNEVVAIREPGILIKDVTKWDCYYNNSSNNSNVLWKSDCIVDVEIYDNNKVNVNSFHVKIIPLLRYEILFMHIIMVLMIMFFILKPFKNNVFYRSLNDILFFICGYIIGSDSSYFSMDLFETGNMIFNNLSKN